MAIIKNLSEGNLSSIFLLIKNKFVQKAFKTGSSTEYKVLSDNDLTNELKEKYDAAHTHSQADHAPADAQANIVEAVKVNGVALTVENKAVDVHVPLLSTDISADKESVAKTATPKAVYDYVAAAIAGVSSLSFKILTSEEYDAETGIPTIEAQASFIYLVPVNGASNNAYAEYIYVDGKWECIGNTEVDLSGYMKTEDLVEFTTEEVNAIWTSVMSS